MLRRLAGVVSFAAATAPAAGSLALCSLPYEAGSCENTHVRYYYDAAERTCKQFNYSGCLGNDNNFLNFLDCMTVCGGFQARRTSTSLPSSTYHHVAVSLGGLI